MAIHAARRQWYCALTPTYHYTRDGYRDSLFMSEHLAGIKRLDKNPAVHGQTRMWATYLHGEDGVLDLALEVSTSTVCRSVLTPPGPGGHPSVGGS